MSEHGPQKVYPKSYKEASNGEYMTAEDLEGKRWTYVIDDLDKKDLEGEDGKVKRRFIYTLRGAPKKWVSNTTNGLCLEAMFGPNPADALGKRVTLVSEPCKVGGKSTTGIRVWGSPDLARDKTISIKVGRQRAVDRTLHAVQIAGQSQTQTQGQRQPPPPVQAPAVDPLATFEGQREWWYTACASLPAGYTEDDAAGWCRELGADPGKLWSVEQIVKMRAALVGAGWKG